MPFLKQSLNTVDLLKSQSYKLDLAKFKSALTSEKRLKIHPDGAFFAVSGANALVGTFPEKP